MANFNNKSSLLEKLDTSPIISSLLYYDKEDLEKFILLFNDVEVKDFRLKKILDILTALNKAGKFDSLPDDPEQRKSCLKTLINDKLAVISDGNERNKVSTWFNSLADIDADLELADELIYRYCWSEFVDRVNREDSMPSSFEEKLMIKPKIPDITREKEIKSLEEVDYDPSAKESEENSEEFKTGIEGLDRLVKMRRTNYVVVAARTTVGKSLFMINQAIHLAKEGKKILYVSLEESEKEIKSRVYSHLYASNCSSKEVMGVYSNFLVYNPTSSVPESIFAEMSKCIKIYGVDCVFVDYLQLMKHHNMSDFESLRAITREMKIFAVANGVLLVTASQLKRDVEYTGTGLSSLYGSSTIEADANVVLLIEVSSSGSGGRVNNAAYVDINVAKNRSGAQGKVDSVLIDYSCGHISDTNHYL